MGVLARIYRQWSPPLVQSWLHRLKWRLRPGDYFGFVGDYPDWAAAAAQAIGYQQELILDRVLQATLAVQRGEAACERDGVAFATPQYEFPLLAALALARPAQGGCLRVWDLGGSLGSTFFLYRGLLSRQGPLSWTVVEQPHFVRAGREHLAEPNLAFHESAAQALGEGRGDVLLCSSVLQYLEAPEQVLAPLLAAAPAWIIVDRTPRCQTGEHLVVQQVPQALGGGSYPCRLQSEAQLLALFPGYRLEFAWENADRIPWNLGPVEFRGCLLRRHE